MDIHTIVHLFHIIIVGGLFLYVGIMRDRIPSWLFPVLFYLGIFIIVYHLYKVYNYITLDKSFWVNLIHIFLVGPLLVYIGYGKESTSRKYFEMLLMLGFASIGYHLYYLVDIH
jgi:hypothetical protein